MTAIGDPAPTFALPDTGGTMHEPGKAPATVVVFKPNGTVTVTQGGSAATSFQISYVGNSNTITVSNYGNLSVTAP